ncbi:MAG: S8 family serine peptidase, partial [Solirubrobacterales bacterium]
MVSQVNCGGSFPATCKAGGMDALGHGTHVAGTIAAIDNSQGVVGVAPGARLWSVKVVNDKGEGNLSELIAGIDWVTANASQIEVANSSLSYRNETFSVAFNEAIKGSLDAGVVHVVSAGNESELVQYIPGNHPDVITVSAVEDLDGLPGAKEGKDPLAGFSNFGTVVDVAAPGVDIVSTFPSNQYGSSSGTSMASPHVAGAAAFLASQSNPESREDIEEIRDQIVEGGNFDWTDTSGDGEKEPLLDLSKPLAVPSAPNVVTEAAASVNATNATLKARINPNGVDTTYQFEYGPTTSYGSKIPPSMNPVNGIGSGTSPVAVPETVSGLSANTTYHYRIVAMNELGTTYGVDKTLTTPRPGVAFIGALGSFGSGSGQFNVPVGLAVDSKDHIWVADSENNRIQEFDDEGEYLSQLGSKGTGNGQLNSPAALSVDSNDHIWVADSNNHRIQEFSAAGEYLGQFGSFGTGNGQLNSPAGLAIDSNDHIWVADAGNNRIQEFSAAGEYLGQFGSFGTGNGQLNGLRSLAIDSNDHIWVADAGNNRIQEFSAAGQHLSQFGSQGSGNGQFGFPVGIVIDPNDHIWVADTENHRIQEFSAAGEYLSRIGSKGSDNGQLNFPAGIVIDSSDQIWVADAANHRIQWWMTGKASATTQAATNVKASEATLKATVNPNGAATTYQFEYGTTTSYGTKIPLSAEAIGSGTSPVAVSETANG